MGNVVLGSKKKLAFVFEFAVSLFRKISAADQVEDVIPGILRWPQ